MQQSTRADTAINKQSTRLGMNEKEKEIFAFFSSSFDVAFIAVGMEVEMAVAGYMYIAGHLWRTEYRNRRRHHGGGALDDAHAGAVRAQSNWPQGRRRRHLADGHVVPADSAKRHNTTINPWGRADMLLKIHLSGPAFGQG